MKKKERKAYEAKICWYHAPFRLIYRYKAKNKERFASEKGIETIKKLKILCKGTMTNTSAIGQHAAHTADQLTSPSC